MYVPTLWLKGDAVNSLAKNVHVYVFLYVIK